MSKQMTPGQDPKQSRLTEALSTIAQEVLGGELEELRKSVASARDDIQNRVDREFENLRKDLFAKLDAISKKLGDSESAGRKTMSELEERSKKTLDQMKQQLRDAEDQASQSLGEAASAFQADLSSREELLKTQIDSVGQKLTGVHGEVQAQVRRTEQMSSLMSGLATVFSSQTAAAVSPPQVPSAPVRLDPESTLDEPANPMALPRKNSIPGSDPAEVDEDFEEALEKVFED